MKLNNKTYAALIVALMVAGVATIGVKQVRDEKQLNMLQKQQNTPITVMPVVALPSVTATPSAAPTTLKGMKAVEVTPVVTKAVK